MNSQTQKIDADLFEILSSLPHFPFYSLIRPDPTVMIESKNAFFSKSTPPKFKYEKANLFDVDYYQSELDKKLKLIDQSDHSDLVKNIYQEKLHELYLRSSIISAIKEKNDTKITELSLELFNPPEENLETLTSEFEEMLSHAHTFFDHAAKVTTEMFIEMTEKVLEHYDMKNWHIKIYSGSSIKLRHGSKKGISTVFIPGNRNLSKARAARLLTHEIEVHALRTMNGRQSPYALLGRGLDKYLQTEEGLAVHYQSQLAKKTHQHLPGFWDSWAVALARQNNFVETFEILAKAHMKLSDKKGSLKTEEDSWNEAWRLCMRVYRGISNTNNGHVVFSRDHIYRSGAILLERTLKERGNEIIPVLFSGKIGIHHLDTMIALDVPRGRVPDMISKEVVREVMRKA